MIPNDTTDGMIVVPHVCNDQGRMGAGFVVPLAKAFPDAKTAYIAWHRTKQPVEHPSPSLNCEIFHFPQGNFGLGQVQFVEVMPQRKVHDKWYPSVVIANMVAQNLGGKRPLHYNHLVACMESVRRFMGRVGHAKMGESSDAEVRILCPMFGGALAGGDWGFVEQLVVDCWMRPGYDVTVSYLKQFLPEGYEPPTEAQHPTESFS